MFTSPPEYQFPLPHVVLRSAYACNATTHHVLLTFAMGIEAEPVAIAPAYPLGGSTQLKGSYQRPIPLDDDKQLDGLPSHPPQKKRKRDATDYEDIIFLPSKALKQPTIPSKTKGAASWRRQRESEQDSEYADIDGFAGEPAKKVKSAGKSKAKPSEKPRKEPEEKRLRKFRPHAPLSYQEIANRALTQRMCVLDRQRVGTVEQPGEVFEVAGSTGNVYTVKVDKVPSCDCPHAVKGNQCKHIVYVGQCILAQISRDLHIHRSCSAPSRHQAISRTSLRLHLLSSRNYSITHHQFHPKPRPPTPAHMTAIARLLMANVQFVTTSSARMSRTSGAKTDVGTTFTLAASRSGPLKGSKSPIRSHAPFAGRNGVKTTSSSGREQAQFVKMATAMWLLSWA